VKMPGDQRKGTPTLGKIRTPREEGSEVTSCPIGHSFIPLSFIERVGTSEHVLSRKSGNHNEEKYRDALGRPLSSQEAEGERGGGEAAKNEHDPILESLGEHRAQSDVDWPEC